MTQNFPILKSLKNKKRLTLAMLGAALVFAANYYVMQNLPGYRDFACVPGAALNSTNIIFSILLSLAVALMIAGTMQLYALRRSARGAAKASSISILATISGFFTVFCTACSLPFLTLFGLSMSLTFFTTYDLYIKTISLTLMFIALFMLNMQLKGECERCAE